MNARTPTSAVLRDLLARAPPNHVTLAWIIDDLGGRSFGLVMLLLALIALVPGLSVVGGALLMVLAVQMIMARRAFALPGFAARRKIPTARLARLIRRSIPPLRRLETLVRPRWPMPFKATNRVIGSVILLLGPALIGPFPFTHVIPALVIMWIAVAYLEEDGVMLAIALTAALASISIAAATVWGAIAGIELLDRL